MGKYTQMSQDDTAGLLHDMAKPKVDIATPHWMHDCAQWDLYLGDKKYKQVCLLQQCYLARYVFNRIVNPDEYQVKIMILH